MAIYMSWLKGGLIEKGLDHFYLRLKVVAEFGDPTDLEDAMMEFLGATNLHTWNCALKGLELFNSTKHKF